MKESEPKHFITTCLDFERFVNPQLGNAFAARLSHADDINNKKREDNKSSRRQDSLIIQPVKSLLKPDKLRGCYR